jgi:hypothetical protein
MKLDLGEDFGEPFNKIAGGNSWESDMWARLHALIGGAELRNYLYHRLGAVLFGKIRQEILSALSFREYSGSARSRSVTEG